MLAVNNKKFLLRLLQAADAGAVRPGLEAQLLRREQQHRAGDGRLRDGRLVKIADGRDLGAGKFALKGLVAAFDFGDELGDVVLRLGRRGLDAGAFLVVKPADEPDFLQKVFGRIRRKIEKGVFLADLSGNHKFSPAQRDKNSKNFDLKKGKIQGGPGRFWGI